MTTRRLTVGVPTRDRPAELAGLLTLLAAERPGLEAAGWQVEVLVADGSTDPASASDGVAVLPVAGGVGEGRNVLADAATGDVLVLVDDDVRPDAGALVALAAAVRPGTAVAGRVAGLGHRAGERSGAGVLRRTGFGGPVPPGGAPDYLVSALLALPRAVYRRVRWDERYAAAHLDDLAFGLRLRAAGVALVVSEEATADHPVRPRPLDPTLAGHRAALVAARFPDERLTRARALAHSTWEHRRSPTAALVAARSFLSGLPAEAPRPAPAASGGDPPSRGVGDRRAISVVVATAGRPERLRACLAALAADRSAGPREVLVVDNAPDLATCAVAEAAGARWLPEPRPGKAYALNTGVAAATGDAVLFCDDDVLVRPGWTDALAAAVRVPGTGLAGGRLLPRWESPPPPWLLGPHAVHLTLRDAGAAPRRLDPPEFAYGASMAAPAAVLARVAGPFDPRLGPRPGRKTGYEEVLLADRVRAQGLAVVHVPGAVAEHCVDPARVDRARLRRLVFQSGFGAARRDRLSGRPSVAYPLRAARVAVSLPRAVRLAARRGPLTPAGVDAETGAWAALGRRLEDLVGPANPRLADRLAETLAGRGAA